MDGPLSPRCLVELLEHGFKPGSGIASRQCGGKAVCPEWECHGGEVFRFYKVHGHGLKLAEDGGEAGEFKLLFEDLALGLEEEKICGIVAVEDFEEQ